MIDQERSLPAEGFGVALVDGDNSVRHARQLLLRSENYDVRSYPTCAALLADPRSRESSCIVIDTDARDGEGINLLRQMRASGWHGRAILLGRSCPDGDTASDATLNGDQFFQRTLADQPLLKAIALSMDRS